MDDLISDTLWQLELLLLFPSDVVPNLSIITLDVYPENDKKELEDLFSFIEYVKNVDIYKAVLMLERTFGMPGVLLDVGYDVKLDDSKDLFDHFAGRCHQCLSSCGFRGIQQVYILGASVLMLHIFLRVNWVGPPANLYSESDKFLADKYKNKVVYNPLDASIDPISPFPSESGGTAFSAYASGKLSDEFNEKCILGPPDSIYFEAIRENSAYSSLLTSIMDDLNIDGETIYTGIRGLPYFYSSLAFLSVLCDVFHDYQNLPVENTQFKLKSTGIWLSRLAYIWQRIIHDSVYSPCISLFKASVLNFADILKHSGLIEEELYLAICNRDLIRNAVNGEASECEQFYGGNRSIAASVLLKPMVHNIECSDEMKSLLLVELLQRLPYYNMNKLYNEIAEFASNYIGFSFEFTGVLGIRRKYQKNILPQLVVSTKGTAKHSGEDESETIAPKNIGLETAFADTDILEKPIFESGEESGYLSTIEQSLLLSKGFQIASSMPEGDDLSLEYLNAIAVKCLDKSNQSYTRWLLSSVALWLRCKTEYHRSKTVERAVLQLYSLSENYFETLPKAGIRLEYFWHTNFPSYWDIKREIAKRMYSIGSFLTAFEMFKKLKMWEDAIECLIMMDRRSDAKKLIMEQLQKASSPMLWCFLGDIEGDPNHYETAWNASSQRCARAQRSLGAHFFKESKYCEAAESLKMALSINPMHERSQFLLGCCYLKLEMLECSIAAFSRVVSLNPDSCDAWANMCGAHLHLKNLKEAKMCIEQGLRCNPEKSQLWDILMRISIMMRDIPNVCRAIENILSLGQVFHIEKWVVAFLVDAACGQRVDERAQKVIEKTLESVTQSITNDSDIWGLYAKYLSFKNDYETALEVTFKEYRAIERNIINNFQVVQLDQEKQLKYDDAQLEKLTNCLGTLVSLFKRIPVQRMRERKSAILMTLEAMRARIAARTLGDTERFLREIDRLIESATTENVIYT